MADAPAAQLRRRARARAELPSTASSLARVAVRCRSANAAVRLVAVAVALACSLPAVGAGAPQPRPRAASSPRTPPSRTAPPLVISPPAGLELRGAPTLGARELLEYERNGHVATRGLLSAVESGLVLAELGAEHERRRAQTKQKLLADHGPHQRKGDVPFEQLFNSWLGNGAARALVGSERLAHTAAQLLGVAPSGVRLYQVYHTYVPHICTAHMYHTCVSHICAVGCPPVPGHPPREESRPRRDALAL
jgi:hypothetical protein